MYQKINDYELIYMVCEDNNDCFRILYDKYQPLIFKVAKKYSKLFTKYGYQIDDLMQIGYMTLYQCYKLYQNYNDTLFYTYFNKALQNSILAEIKRNNVNKKKILNESVSYDNTIEGTDLSYLDVIAGKDKINYENNFFILNNFKNSLSFDEGNIFELFYNGYLNGEISILLDIDIKEVRLSLNKIKKQSLTFKYLFL